jgi:hypothetical protein
MKRLTTAVITLAFLALTASAFAQTWSTSSRLGSKYGSQVTTGSCKVTRQPTLGTAMIVCGASGGTAAVRYPFTLRHGCGPSVSPTVDYLGSAPTVSARSANGSVTVAARFSGQDRTVISRVTIAYYCG